MKEGYLTWDSNSERPDIRYHDGSYYGGLRCGNTLEALIRGCWRPARIEYCHSSGTWYLECIEDGNDILGLTVRN